jgi:hypothetical protein
VPNYAVWTGFAFQCKALVFLERVQSYYANYTFKDEALTALFKEPVRTAQ